MGRTAIKGRNLFEDGEVIMNPVQSAPCDGVAYNTLTNTVGVGNVVPAGMTGMGSGDRYPSLGGIQKKHRWVRKG